MYRPVLAIAVGVAAFALCAQHAAGQPPPTSPPGTSVRSAAPAPAAGGTIRGRVTVAGSSRPIRRVRIGLTGSSSNQPGTVTDALGTFELTEVPPGNYTITASRTGYVTRQYGQRRPLETGAPVTIAGGQVIEGVDIALSLGAVMAGRITDELGEPLPGARVEAVESRYIRGHRVAVPARVTTTNDQGDYHLSGLETGVYQLRASSTDVWESDDGRTASVFVVTYYPGVLAADRP
ncbi:MAG: carboxypeptidase regulatory-like domain-containing protein [Acidobacteriota bacterium]